MSDSTYQPKVYRKQGGDILAAAYGGKILVEGYNAGAGLSDFWDDCPLVQMSVDPTLGITAGDDFVGVQATGFPYALTGTNGTYTATAANAYGVATIRAPGTDNDEAYLTSNNNAAGLIKADATHNWWFEARVKLSQIAAEQGAFVGMAGETTVGADFMTDNTMALKVVDSIGFQVVHAAAAAAIWQSIIQLGGGARAAVNATVATGSTDWVKLGMKSVLGTVTFYVDGVADASTTTSATANFPLDKYLQITFGTKTGKGAANSLAIDWWRAAQLR